MAGQRSRTELLKFLDYVRIKGLVSPATAEARKASANKVLGILSEEEAEDVLALDLDQVVTRFGNLHGKSYTPDSLRTYKSRTKSSLDDFARYLENPMAFKSGVQLRERKQKNGKSELESAAANRGDEVQPTIRHSPMPTASSNIVPIPLRADLTIHVQGLPFDLTEPEAKKIANVILAMAAPVS